jgi:hypothetical protein
LNWHWSWRSDGHLSSVPAPYVKLCDRIRSNRIHNSPIITI